MDWNYLFNLLSDEKTNRVIDTILKITSLFALGLALKTFWNWLFRPKLLIGPMKVGLWKYKDTGWQREVVTLEVRTNRNRKALGAKAIIKVLSKPPDANALENERDLHWAGTDYLASTTAEYPIDIGMTPQRLDVFFTHEGQKMPGCWLGTSWALMDVPAKDQYYMPPGKYEFELKVVSENGKGQKRRYRFSSPNQGEKLAKPEEIQTWIRKFLSTISFHRKLKTEN
jgi:hypothetical protein